jgi:hypothetical protein
MKGGGDTCVCARACACVRVCGCVHTDVYIHTRLDVQTNNKFNAKCIFAWQGACWEIDALCTNRGTFSFCCCGLNFNSWKLTKMSQCNGMQFVLSGHDLWPSRMAPDSCQPAWQIYQFAVRPKTARTSLTYAVFILNREALGSRRLCASRSQQGHAVVRRGTLLHLSSRKGGGGSKIPPCPWSMQFGDSGRSIISPHTARNCSQ